MNLTIHSVASKASHSTNPTHKLVIEFFHLRLYSMLDIIRKWGIASELLVKNQNLFMKN